MRVCLSRHCQIMRNRCSWAIGKILKPSGTGKSSGKIRTVLKPSRKLEMIWKNLVGFESIGTVWVFFCYMHKNFQGSNATCYPVFCASAQPMIDETWNLNHLHILKRVQTFYFNLRKGNEGILATWETWCFKSRKSL